MTLIISNILETEDVINYLQKRHLVKQYLKAKQFLLSDNLLNPKFKERNPKGSNIWYFRINKQFRAFCTFDDKGDLIIYKIDNHQ